MKSFNMLRKMSLLLLASLFVVVNSQAQTLKEFFTNNTPLTYLGVDFTQARVIGEAVTDANDIRDRFYSSINNVIIGEPKKYDLAAAFHTEVSSDLDIVKKRNAAIDIDHIKSSNSADFSRLKTTDIDKLVKSYDFGARKGVGLLFVMDGMSKPEQAANVYVTLIDMSSKKVLLTEKMEGKAGGFGFRNYWVHTIYEVLKDIKKGKYNEWKKKAASEPDVRKA
jgi:hypothetical protein